MTAPAGRPSGRPSLHSLTVLALVIAGCGAAGAVPAPVATSEVDLPASYRFAPADIVVPAGTTVTWTNRDHFTHSVQVLDGAAAGDARLMEPGAAVAIGFMEPGTYRYQCHLHPTDMRGTVTVTP